MCGKGARGSSGNVGSVGENRSLAVGPCVFRAAWRTESRSFVNTVARSEGVGGFVGRMDGVWRRMDARVFRRTLRSLVTRGGDNCREFQLQPSHVRKISWDSVEEVDVTRTPSQRGHK